MRCFASLVICLALAVAAFAQTPSTQPAVDSTEPKLDKLFRSRTQGIQFNPPAGGSMIRELNTGDIVRFVYADNSWDIRVKPIPLHIPMRLSAPPDAGVLELTASHLTDSNPTAVILRKEVTSIHGKDVGQIEATYKAGTDHIFAQQAIFKDYEDKGRHYFSVQMTSKDSAQDNEQARKIFQLMLNTVQVLNQDEVADEQLRRVYKTHELWLLLKRDKILAALEPLHFMRVTRDGRDVGFIQVNERPATHNSNEGYEIIIHSRMEVDPQQEHPGAPAASVTGAPAESNGPNGIVLPGRFGPAAAAATQPTGARNLYTYSTYFVTFDRDHEDWTTITQTDNDVANQLTEFAYSDKTFHRHFEVSKTRALLPPTTGPQENTQGSNQQPGARISAPSTEPILVPKYILDVSYSHGRRQDPPTDSQLPPFYLPQALGQLLPRVLPTDPGQYMFAFYVSGQRNVMARYVDVESSRDVNLDGQIVRAVPITDRIGLDGIATTHYVTRQGEWLGSVNDDSHLGVFPTDANTLKGLWGTGFAVCPEPPADDMGGNAASPDVQNLKQNSR